MMFDDEEFEDNSVDYNSLVINRSTTNNGAKPKLGNDSLYKSFQNSQSSNDEPPSTDHFYNFKLKLAGDKHTNNAKGQFVRIPHFVSAGGSIGGHFNILCTRPITTTEIIQIYDDPKVKPTTSIINEFPLKSNVFEFTSTKTSLKKCQATIKLLQQKFNLEYSKAETNCGLCIGQREENLFEAAQESSYNSLHIVREIEKWTKKTQLNRFIREYCLDDGKVSITAQKDDKMSHHNESSTDNKVIMKEYFIPSKDEIINDNTSDDVLLIIFPMFNTLEDAIKKIWTQRSVISDMRLGYSFDHKDYSNLTKLYVGDVKYINWREEQNTDIVFKEILAEENSKSLIKRKMDTIEQVGSSLFAELRQSLEKINFQKNWNNGGRFINPYIDMASYAFESEAGNGLYISAHSTRKLEIYDVEELILHLPEVKTFEDVVMYYWNYQGKVASKALIADSTYDVDSITEAYAGYLKYIEQNQCTSCYHSCVNDGDDCDEDEQSEREQFLYDANIVNNNAIVVSFEFECEYHRPELNSFLNSVASQNGLYDLFPDYSQSMHLVKLPSRNQNLADDIMVVMTPTKDDFNIEEFLKALRGKLINDKVIERDTEEKSSPDSVKFHVGAGELFEQEIYESCQMRY
ncbi:hypothetical protein BN7_5237 [Wickerhamomyces ciferrii]|uniref:Uncharacterized protein n=1 Tax=Wickerhamomyces ciferrii (strain ATCC 14091 / BCRC 22168 / CBS 111 / JCM 3599 / NBRC 0793 / NRRL Y-1031 F-60-10) TaxID=1206466 RepID=K0KUL9_WICCF|nr:uncharacterized protein BN7_5237 [Wickerhamomyces ciferrii]CCH45652.1 hypothetical protein BN7_5237 [Wickerhamomyces ciferrii]